MIDISLLNDVKALIKQDCRLSFKDKKDISKQDIEQIVQHHIDGKFKNYINRRSLYEEVRDEVFNLFFTKKGNIVGIINEKDHEDWFERKFIENKPYWEIYRQYLVDQGKIPLQSINDLDNFTDTVLSSLEDPKRKGNWDRRGMVVGSVQSGKTANFLGLIAKARDAGYKFIIILSGSNNDLRQQTQQRIDEGYIGIRTFEYEKKSKTKDFNKVGLFRQNQFKDKFQVPTFGTIDDIRGDFNKSRASGMQQHIIQDTDFNSYIFVVKKNKTPLTNLIDWLLSLNQCNEKSGAVGFSKIPGTNSKKPPFITEFPLLLIDDECDHYSIDTGKAPRDNNGKFLEEYNPKTINALIRKLLQCFSRRNYVGYTATPFANILVHENKSHKDYGEDIFPKSFIYDIKPPSNHQGLETIFKGENDDEGIKSENLSNFLVPINDFCIEPSNLFCKEGWFPPKHKSDHVPKYDDSTHPVDDNLDENTLNFYLKLNHIAKKKYGKDLDIAPSLIHAIMSFILACAVRNIRSINQFYSHKSMLIHVTKNVEPQNILTNNIIRLFDCMLECLKDENENKEIFHNSLKYIYERYFLKDTIEFNDQKKETITYEKILHNENGLKFCISEISRHIIKMSGNTSKPNYDSYRDDNGCGYMAIIIGGDKLSRGVTFDGLSTTYFLRSSKMFDTLMQMGRWFGYREGYQDLCRLYTSADLLDAFVEISIATQEVRSEISRMNKLKKTPKDFGLWIQTSPYCHYIPTARNKMRHAQKTFINYSSWGNQMPTLPWEKDVVIKNFENTSKFLKKLNKPDEINIKRDFGINIVTRKKQRKKENIKINADPSYLWKNISHENIIDFLKDFTPHESSKFQPQEMADYIKQAAQKKNMLKNWSVAVMGNGSSGLKVNIDKYEVNLAFRKPKNTFTDDKATYGVIWDPVHEGIDIDPKKFREANTEFYSNETDMETNDSTAKIKFTKLLRQKRSNKNGLLLIYPILPISFKSVKDWDDFKINFEKKYKEREIKKEIDERKALISLAISFPETSDDLATHAIVNSTYARLQKEEDGDEI